MKLSQKLKLYLLAREVAGIESEINLAMGRTIRTVETARRMEEEALAKGLIEVPLSFDESFQNLVDDINAYDRLLERAAANRKRIENIRGFAEKTRLSAGVLFGEFLGLFMTRKAYRRYVYPQVAEIQAEYAEELAAGRLARARWVSLRGLFYLIPGWMYGLVAKVVWKMFST